MITFIGSIAASVQFLFYIASSSSVFPFSSSKALVSAFVPPVALTKQQHTRRWRILQVDSKHDDAADSAIPCVSLIVTQPDNDILTSALEQHKMVPILNVKLQFHPFDNSDSDNANIMQNLDEMDAICFATSDTVKEYLKQLDEYRGDSDCSDEDKRGLGCGNVMAVCVNTASARTALETGRFMSNHIYYPKGDEDGHNVSKWSDMTMQAVGDILERKFWGGGW